MKIFFIGIGGKGINGIAQICLEKGYQVFGVDENVSSETEKLKKSGAIIYQTHKAENVTPIIDLVVRTSAVSKCPEIDEATRLNIPIMKRSEFLHTLVKDKLKISIAGSHGKSTTTAIAGLSFINNNFSPTIYGGAYIKELDSYNQLGNGKMAVIEACEFDRSFFDLVGDVTIITRAEKSHPEYYKDEGEMLLAYKHFINMHKDDALILINGDDDNLLKISGEARAKVVSFGMGELNDYQLINVYLNKNNTQFSLIKNSGERKIIVSNFKINLPGIYNAMNFASVLAMHFEMNLSLEGVKKTAETFNGVGRRFEMFELADGRILIDDFAHHPTQVKNLVSGLRQFFPNKKICAVFQPRQYNLIRSYLAEYGSSFADSDEVIVTDIVPALGDSTRDINSLKPSDIVNSIKYFSRRTATYKKSFQEIVDYVKGTFDQNTVIATIGAGNIYQIKDLFKN